MQIDIEEWLAVHAPPPPPGYMQLRRIDPARNMARFYAMTVQRDLFGMWCVVREWGRIGRGGRVIAEPYDSETLAAIAVQRQVERKRRRGYA